MAESPYRQRSRPVEEPSPRAPPVLGDIACITTFVWLSTLVRVGVALVMTEPQSRELDFAWLILFFAPVVIWKEIASRRRAQG